MNDLISEYKQKLEAIKVAEGAQAVAGVWQKLNDLIGHMSAEQLAYVQANPAAVKKKQELNALFLEWLFERHKNEFVQAEPFNSEARAYVDVIESAASEFSEHNKNLAEENEALKAEIERLKRVAI